MKQIVLFLLFTVFFSCKPHDDVRSAEISFTKLLREGEWKDASDSTRGVSVRENKLAFFKAMAFNSADIYDYVIVDSLLKKDGEAFKSTGEYLLLTRGKDSLRYRILKHDSLTLSLKIRNTKKVYTFWR